MYAVWPLASRQFDFDRVNESYTLAAADVNGMLFPVGEAWRAAWRRDPNLALYAAGRSAPERARLVRRRARHRVDAARPLAQSACRRVCRSRTGATIAIPPADAAVLQEAAAEAIAKFGKR